MEAATAAAKIACHIEEEEEEEGKAKTSYKLFERGGFSLFSVLLTGNEEVKLSFSASPRVIYQFTSRTLVTYHHVETRRG